MEKIYGIDPTEKVTPEGIRDAIMACFKQAHGEFQKEVIESVGIIFEEGEKEKAVYDYIKQVVRKAFSDTGGNFANPNKESIIKAIGWLADFSKNFRDQETIKKHYSEIMQLVDKLD